MRTAVALVTYPSFHTCQQCSSVISSVLFVTGCIYQCGSLSNRGGLHGGCRLMPLKGWEQYLHSTCFSADRMATNSQQPREVWEPQEMQGYLFSFGVNQPQAGLSQLWDTHGSVLLPWCSFTTPQNTLSAISVITSIILFPSTAWTATVPEKAIFHPGAGLQRGSSLASKAITRPRCLCAMDGTIHHSLGPAPAMAAGGAAPAGAAGEPAPCSSPHGHLLLNPGTISWLRMNPVFLLQNACIPTGHCWTGSHLQSFLQECSDLAGLLLQTQHSHDPTWNVSSRNAQNLLVCSLLLQTQHPSSHPLPLHALPAVPARGICFCLLELP